MRTKSFPTSMLRLSTIGSVAIHIDNVPVPPANQQVFSALFYLTVERGTPTPRRLLAEMFFPDAVGDAGNHSLRQLIYRLRKLGVRVDADQLVVSLPAAEATWDVEDLLSRGAASAEVLDSLRRGYLDDYAPRHSDRFTRWLEEHRVLVSTKLRHLLIEQMNGERSQKRYRSLDGIARAVLALDPLNEEATLAAAESMAMSGAKAQALAFLDAYLDEIGTRSAELRVNPRILRERISRYVPNPDATEQLPLVGRDKELATLIDVIDQASAGSPQVCIVTGPSGIGKSRLLIEACSMAALAGKRVIRVRLQPHDTRRAFAVLRDLGPGLLDLPGAIGASPEALAAVKGLCGRGPSTYQSIPTGALEAEALVSEVKSRVVEVADAVAGEQPVVVCIEDAHWIDEASLELISELVSEPRALCILLASQRPVPLPLAAASLGLTYIGLGSLGIDKALTLLRSLFANVKRAPDQDFIEFAARMAGGVPFYLHVLFRSFLETGDLRTIPESLSEFLVERLSQLPEPARSVYDAIVILGSHSSETRLAQVTELPRYELIGSIRMLDAAGLIHVTSDTIRPSHELFATTAIRQMPVSISRLLHRAAARLLETESPQIEPLELAAHWEACNEQVKVFDTLMRSAADYLRLGRAREAITLLERARKTGGDEASQRQSGVALFLAFCAAGDSSEAIAMAEVLRLADGNLGPELQLREIEARGRAGQPVAEFRTLLTGLVFDGNSGDAIRLQAAKLLMMIAEDANDAELARSVLDAVDYTDQESLNKLVVGLIYETVFGYSKVALQIARRLCDTFGRGSNAEALEVLSNAGFALWRNGECDEGIALYERAYGVARSQRIWSSCLLISASIADMHWIAGRTAKADEWLEIAGRHFDQMDHPDRGFQYLALRVVRLLEHGDVDAADATLAHAERVYPTILRDRYGLERLAYRLRIQLARGGPVDPAQVQELLAGHIARRDKGLQDVVADTVIGSLIHGGRSDEARTVRDDYLKVYRRDGFPPPRALTYLMA